MTPHLVRTPVASTCYFALVTAISALAMLLVSGTLARAERPAFQAPFPCGQIWDASTYEGHGSNAIDVVERNSDLTIIGEYQPAIAAAAGTVAFDYTWPGGSKKGERWVMIDHGDGWRTHYFHLQEESGKPRLAVGRRVAMGEILGRTSNSGVDAVHLHFAEAKNVSRDGANLDSVAKANVNNWGKVLNDGTVIRARFNENLINTYLANRNSWGTFGTHRAEKIRSFNCPAGRFVHWTSGGANYILRYSPGNWGIRVNRINPTTGDNPLMFTQNWGANWNTIVPFYSATNGQPHLIQYNFASGEVQIRRVNPGNDGLTFLKSVRKYAGWTDIVPITMGGKPHAIFYDSRYGWFNVDEMNVTSDGFVSRLKTKTGTGFTNLVPYEDGPRRYVLMYRGSTGFMALHELKKRSDGKVTLTRRVWSASRASGWTHFALLMHRGQRQLLGYNSVTGDARLWHIKSQGKGLEGGARLSWRPGWTALTPYLHDGRAYVLLYRLTDGLSRKIRLRDDLTGFKLMVSENWATGYR